MLINMDTVLSTSVRQNSQHWQLMIRDERRNLVIQHIYGGDWCFCRVELCESYLSAGINECLLINMSKNFARCQVRTCFESHDKLDVQFTASSGFSAPYFLTFHSPSPKTFRPVESIAMWRTQPLDLFLYLT